MLISTLVKVSYPGYVHSTLTYHHVFLTMFISNYFTLTRGIRQCCPILALLFILVAEILAKNLRTNLNIKGLTINNCEFKIAQLAHSETLFLEDLNSLKTVIEMF